MTQTEPEHRWWYCPECQAVNDGLEASRCWNCSRVQRKIKHFPWCEMGKETCSICGRRYVTWTLPPDTVLRGEPYELGFCVFYFQEDHYGERAYYPPMLPAYFVLEANGYRYDQDKDQLVKVRKARV
jgi:hypothetical protein